MLKRLTTTNIAIHKPTNKYTHISTI
jgi:hypothetical protein